MKHATALGILAVIVSPTLEGGLALAESRASDAPSASSRDRVEASTSPAEYPLLSEARLAVRRKDFTRAVELWRRAARRGHARAQYQLGVAYRNGTGVERDLSRAVRWLSKAAEGGSADAHYTLGEMRRTGLGLERDRDRALVHLGKAAAAGNEAAQRRLDGLGRVSSGAFAYADPRVLANRRDPREALAQVIRTGEASAVKEAIARGAPLDGAPGDRSHWRPLVLAIDRGRVDIVRTLLSNQADPNVRSRRGEPALVLAVGTGDRSLVRSLLDAGARVDLSSPSGYSPLMEAARGGHVGIASDLIGAGASVTHALADGTSAASIARRFGHDALHRRLVQRGARDTATERAPMPDASTISIPPIVEAARRGDLELVLDRVDHGDALDTRDAEGNSALLRAADGGHVDVVRALLGVGVDPDQRGPDRETATMRAMKSRAAGAAGVMRVLFEAGADPAARGERGEALIDFAADGGTETKLAILSEAGGSFSVASARAALERAAAGGHAEAVAALYGWVPEPRAGALCRAIARGHDAVVLQLLDRGAEPSGECGAGATPLATAIRTGDESLVRRLLDHGADSNELQGESDPALILAAGLGQPELVRLLVERGADVDQSGAGNTTALMAAAARGHAEVVRVLLGAGARRRIRSDTDQTALDLAVQADAEDVAELIRSRPASWTSWWGGR